ncbi:MAG: hypothetical protein IJ248_01960 [Candidatus Methanomethylophilaceae archaeon]|nr:hypothetical protein [Candidatus Methanomethylophilaceae archaeon]
MDEKTTKMVVIIVAVVAVVAIAAFFMMNNGGGSGDDKKGEIPDLTEFPARLAVLGNANCDDYLDDKDVAYVEKLIKESNFDYAKEFMCDANYDGYIDDKDVDVIKKMIDYKQPTVYYFGVVDYDVREYHTDVANHYVCPLIAPPFDACLILGADLIKGADDRIVPETGNAHDRYTTALDLSKLVNVGSCNTPSKEAIATLLKQNDNCMTLVCGQHDYYADGYEDLFGSQGLQIIRMGSWEGGVAIHGLLTTAYLLDRMDEAYDYLEWYDGVEDMVAKKMKSVTERKNAICFYTDQSEAGKICLLGNTAAENAMLTKVNSYDIGTTIFKARGGSSIVTGDKMQLTSEQLASDVATYKIDTIIGLTNTPLQSKTTAAVMAEKYADFAERMGTAVYSQIDLSIGGYVFASGLSEVIAQVVMGYVLYDDVFTKADIETVCNEYVEMLGIDEKWNYDTMNQLYCGEGDDRNILNMG